MIDILKSGYTVSYEPQAWKDITNLGEEVQFTAPYLVKMSLAEFKRLNQDAQNVKDAAVAAKLSTADQDAKIAQADDILTITDPIAKK